jgi:hypothetical protein
MKFFVPQAKSEEEAAHTCNATKTFAAETTGWKITDRRIQGIVFRDKKKTVHAEVGKHEPICGEMLIAILESNTFLLCTPNRGVLRGEPIMVGKREVDYITDFDKPEMRYVRTE